MPGGQKVTPKPWWYPWGEAQWRQDPRSKGMVKLKPGVWGTAPVPPRPSWEVAEAAGEGPFWVDEYPNPPYELYGGWDWKKITHPTGRQEWQKYNKLGEAEAGAQAAIAGGWGGRPASSERELIELQQAPEWARIELAQAAQAAEQAERQAPETLTPWQKAQLELQERQIRAGQELSPWQRAQITQQERQWKARQLAGPESWIERWFYEQQQPTTERMRTIRGLREEREELKAGLRARPSQLGPMIGQVSAEGVPLGLESPQLQARQGEAEEGGVVYNPTEVGLTEGVWGWPGVYATQTASGGWSPVEIGAPEPTPEEKRIIEIDKQLAALAATPLPPISNPPAPPWLPTFVPSLAAGQPITKQPALTLSGQQAQQISPKEWRGLSGYLGWAGVPGQAASLEDYVARMEAMIPQAQARRPQWGRTRSYV